MNEPLWDMRMKGHHQAVAPLRRLPGEAMSLGECDARGGLSGKDRRKCIYIHVPFCSRICSFCNMRRSNMIPPERYGILVAKQIERLGKHPYIQSGTYEAVYFGGGTPTTLGAEQLGIILRALRNHLDIAPDAEISVETSVTDLTDDKLAVLRGEGVNRLSMGIQTFADQGRKTLGRRNTGETVARRISDIVRGGLSNVNIDLIYNYPGQTDAELELDIARVRELDIAGLSYYSLMIARNSILGKKLGMDDDAYARRTFAVDHSRWTRIYDALCREGFETLELTKLVRPGRDEYRYIRIRHGNGDTLPIGAGAGGRIGAFVVGMPVDPDAYEALLEMPPEEGYRGRMVGAAYDDIYRQIGKLQLGYLDSEGMPEAAGTTFSKIASFIESNGLGCLDNGRIALNRDGLFWGNNIAHWYADRLVGQAGEIWGGME